MAKLDLKKAMKSLYAPTHQKVDEVDVPPMNYLMIDGEGDPNTSRQYKDAVEALYAMSYALRAAVKKQKGVEFTVMPLEGLWWTQAGTSFDINNKSAMKWTAMILQPEHVTREFFEQVLEEVRKKKKLSALEHIRFEAYEEGPSVQILHVGSYAEEKGTIDKLHEYAGTKGYRHAGKHHEIYLSNPIKTEPAKLKTIIRQPIK